MAVAIKSRDKLPDTAKLTADLIDNLGFKWSFDYEYPTSRLEQRVQIRNEQHNAPAAQVAQYRKAMERGDRFAPVVITRDGWIVDGNTRIEAAKQNKYPTIQAMVLDEDYQDATSKARRRLHILGAGFNARNGKGIDREEVRRAVETIATDTTYDATRIAALLGVTDTTVKGLLYEKRARDRATSHGINVNGSMTAAQLKTLGQTTDKINDGPFQALFRLAQDAGMTGAEISRLIRQMREAKSDQGALEVLDRERESRREQIAEYRASGKSKPPGAAQLRQRLGFIIGHQDDPRVMVEHNPHLSQSHLAAVERAIRVLQAVAEEQRAVLPLVAG